MSTEEAGSDARRSRRYSARIECDLTQGPTTTRVVSVDVSHHGVFLATKTPPRERFLVRVTLHLNDGPLYANAFVSRRVAPGAGTKSGVGVQFFAMPERAKRRWDNFIQSLASNEPVEDSEDGVASFLVKLDNTEKLREFFDRALRTNSLYMVTSALRPVGSRVAVVMVHPLTGSEFVLYGHITRVRVEVPRGLEVHVDPLPLTEHAAFGRFLLGEDPLALTPLPDVSTDELMDAPPSAPQLRLPPPLPQVLRDSAPPPPPPGSPPPPPPENLRAINVDLGGPPLEYEDEIRVEDSFEWASVGEEVVIDVDLSEIAGEDLRELQAEAGLRVTTSLSRIEAVSSGPPPPIELPAAIPLGPPASPEPPAQEAAPPAQEAAPPAQEAAPPAQEAAPTTTERPAPSVERPAELPVDTSEAELPSELVDLGSILLSPNDPRMQAAATEIATARGIDSAIPQARRVSTNDDDDTSEAKEAEPITGDLPPEAPKAPKPRRVRSSKVPPAQRPLKSKIPEADTDRGSAPPPRAPVEDPPASSLPSAVRAAILACPACEESSPIVTGPAPGALAPFARNRLFQCRSCRRVVSITRVASAKSRQASRAAAEAQKSVPKVPITLAFDVAELARAPRCPACEGSVAIPKSLAAVVAAMNKLPAETKLPRHRCWHCDHLGLVVKPA